MYFLVPRTTLKMVRTGMRSNNDDDQNELEEMSKAERPLQETTLHKYEVFALNLIDVLQLY